MRRKLGWTLLSVAIIGAGCKSGPPKQEVTELPPPPRAVPEPLPPTESVASNAPAPAGDPFGSTADTSPVLGYSTHGGEYIVRRGDTLWSIARSQYGSGQRWRDIVNANPGLVPERMAVGQKLVMP